MAIQQPQVYIFNGMLNTPVLGFPGWVWVLLIFIIIAIFSNFYWFFMFWDPLKPLHGLWRASRAKSDASLLVDENNTLKLVSETRAKVIFNETIEEARKGEKDWKDIISGQMGTTGIDFIEDIAKWTDRTTEEHQMIEEVADNWNMEHPNDQIHSYSKFIRYALENKLDANVPTQYVVKWIRIESAFPVKRNTADYDGYIRQLAAKFDKEDKTKFDNIAVYIVIGSIIISALMIIGKLLIHKG